MGKIKENVSREKCSKKARQMRPAGLGFVIKPRCPGWSSSPRPPKKHCGTCPRPVSGHRKSNYFLNGPADTETSFISPPRGCRDPQRTRGPAQKESGSYINNTVPGRPPQGSGEKAPRETTGTLTPGTEVCQSVVGLAERLVRACPGLVPPCPPVPS